MKILAAYLHACGDLALALTGDPQTPITSVVADSRQVTPGALFVAIHGAKQDGSAYLAEAIAKGAAAVAYAGPERTLSVPALHLAHDYRGYGRLAECAAHFPARRLALVGVTGTKGKTTTAFLLRDLFRRAGKIVGMIGTVQYELGARTLPGDRTTPTALELQGYFAEMVASAVQVAVLEVSSHALDQERLGSAQFAVAVFTNLSREHLDYHPTMEAYFEAKKRLFLHQLRPDGTAVINLDNEWGRRLAADLRAASPKTRQLTYGEHPDADLRPLRATRTMAGTDLELTWNGLKLPLHTPLVGRYNVSNVMAAVGSALAAGIGPKTITPAMRDFAGVPGRLQRVPGSGGVQVFVDYAHTHDSLENVLSTLKPDCQGRLLVVFGCGGDRDPGKRPLMAAVAAKYADHTWITSDNPRTEDPAAIIAQILVGVPPGAPHTAQPDRRAAIFAAIAAARPGDTVILAGKGHEDYQEIHGVKHPFSDLAVAQQALAAKG